MGIVDDDIAAVRAATDIVAVVSQYAQLKRVGRRWVGLCPFHAEKTPSFSVNQEEGLYYCFGCQAKGDVITFLREIEHLDFVGAVESLATTVGITLHYTAAREGEDRKRRNRLVDAMRRAVSWYHDRLLTARDAGPARGYLRSRGFDGDAVREYQIGWAPEGWDELARALNVSNDVWCDSGLGFLNRHSRQTDAFRGRVLFPIFDTQGDPVAFGGRVLPGADGPKYKNSPETPIYSKSKVLYGLNWVKGDLVTANEAIVCEGYTDVIGFARVGIPRAVATCGTALTAEHLQLVRRFARRVVLAFDADAAGRQAAERFYAWERSLDLEVLVAALPVGADPADLAFTDPAALCAAVDDAQPFLAFRLARVLAAAHLDTAEGRARAAEETLAVIGEHPSELVRDQYVMQLADQVRIDPDRLRARLRSPGAARVQIPPRPQPRVQHDSPELEALRHAIHNPDAVAAFLSDELFADERCLAAFRALARAKTLAEALEETDPGAAELLHRLAVEETDSEPEDAVARLVGEAARRAVWEEEAAARRTGVVVSLAPAKLAIEQLHDSRSRLETVQHLLAWLSSRTEDRG